MTEKEGILTICDIREDGMPSALSLQVIGIGKELAKTSGRSLFCVIMGGETAPAAESVLRYGVEKVFCAKGEQFRSYNPELFSKTIKNLCDKINLELILLGSDEIGMDLGPRIAFSMQSAVVTDCVGLRFETGGEIRCTKPIYGSNALAVYTAKEKPMVAVVRSGVGEAPAEENATGSIEDLALDAELESRIEIIERVKEDTGGVRLEEAGVVVSGGRGIGGKEGFESLNELASVFGGAVGASRPPCDAGWITSQNQVGITGKIVSPNLYFAIAISGSSQHLSGMADSKNIIAINKDPDAYIFKVAHYGVVDDWKTIMPAFVKNVKELIGN